jgi:hypothetical protein
MELTNNTNTSYRGHKLADPRSMPLNVPKNKIKPFMRLYAEMVDHFGTHVRAEQAIGLSNSVITKMRAKSVLSVRSARILLHAHARYIPKTPSRPNVVRKNPIVHVTYEQATKPSLEETPIMLKKTTNKSKAWTKREINFLINNPNMPAKEIGKKLKRTLAAVSIRRNKLGITQSIDKAQPKHIKIGPAVTKAKAKAKAKAKTKAKAKAAVPVTPVYTYEGKHNIATFNKLGWFTRTLLGVRAA